DAGRQVGDADRRVGGVHALAAGTGGAVDVDAELLLVDLDVVGLLDDRNDVHPGEGGLATALVVERADPDQAVGAVLTAQRAVRVGGLDREGGGLDAGLFGVRGLVDLRGVALALGPQQEHAQQHLRTVGGVDATGLGVDGHQRFALVVLA